MTELSLAYLTTWLSQLRFAELSGIVFLPQIYPRPLLLQTLRCGNSSVSFAIEGEDVCEEVL